MMSIAIYHSSGWVLIGSESDNFVMTNERNTELE